MKALLCFPGCHRRAGVERVVFEAAQFLAGRGHEVTVAAKEFEENGSHGIRFSKVEVAGFPRFLRGRRFFEASSERIRSEDFDVLNTHGCVCPLDGVHWVHSVHRAWLDRAKVLRRHQALARWRQRLNPLHPVLLRLEEKHFRDRRYQKLIATTAAVREDLQRYYDVPPEDVAIVPNGFSPTEFNPQRRAEKRQAMRHRLGLSDDHLAVLFVANELERKGYPTLLSALRKLARKNLRLLVVGRASRTAVRRAAAAAGLQDQVIACGATSSVADYHAAADLFVLPTQYEAFCLAILEALGSGLPVITTTVPGARDAIESGVNGLLIEDPKSGEELASAMESMLEEAVRAGMSRAAPATVAQYQWPVTLLRYEQVLLEHCAKPVI